MAKKSTLKYNSLVKSPFLVEYKEPASLSDVRPVREKGERKLGAEGAEKFSGHFDKGFADFL